MNLVVDVTDAALARRRAVLATCDRCAAEAELYRLIGTSEALCAECFADVHAA